AFMPASFSSVPQSRQPELLGFPTNVNHAHTPHTCAIPLNVCIYIWFYMEIQCPLYASRVSYLVQHSSFPTRQSLSPRTQRPRLPRSSTSMSTPWTETFPALRPCVLTPPASQLPIPQVR